jgi:hypothetical protein
LHWGERLTLRPWEGRIVPHRYPRTTNGPHTIPGPVIIVLSLGTDALKVQDLSGRMS